MRQFINIVENALDVPTMSVKSLATKYGVSQETVEKQLNRGIEVDREHNTDDNVAKEIALDHLGERLDYYVVLDKAEKAPMSDFDLLK